MRPTRPRHPSRGFELDWVVVSVAGVKRWGLLVFFLVLAGGGVGVGPDSLLGGPREARAGREPSAGEVKVKVGQVNVYTATNPSSVVTDAARADVDRDSRVGVGGAEERATTVA